VLGVVERDLREMIWQSFSRRWKVPMPEHLWQTATSPVWEPLLLMGGLALTYTPCAFKPILPCDLPSERPLISKDVRKAVSMSRTIKRLSGRLGGVSPVRFDCRIYRNASV
jgi:hypothetical protein